MKGTDFSFSDLIAGYVVSADPVSGDFKLKTSDGREFSIGIAPAAHAKLLRNLGEPYRDCTDKMKEMLVPGCYLYVYGTFYPEDGGLEFEAQQLTFVGDEPGRYRAEERDWWIQQIQELSEFYLRAQFEGGPIDYSQYRTHISLDGRKLSRATVRQETDTISRLVYGFATAFLMTGEDRYLEAAEKGTEYLREHMRFRDVEDDIVYWYHGIDVRSGHEEKVRASTVKDRVGAVEDKIFASEFGDDYDAIPAYEQIYALAGPVQTYRITGDPRILEDAERTVSLFRRYFRDPSEQGGYFSHLDPITLDGRSPRLGDNRARKNWNSVGDHAPAYLLNLFLATGDERYADFLAETADTIVRRFPEPFRSPFVQERFHEDWSPDREWRWQQDRAVVGHNAKIAWNLMRIHHLRPDARYVELARALGETMPAVGSDRQRGGWYDVMERMLRPGKTQYHFTWHDRKAWWQQEQAILAYLILAGSLGDETALRHAREASSFYNAFFLDHEDGAVYFNVLANGVPYLMGNERLKGSHSMSGYHAFELCYLAAVYTNLLITKQPMDFYFKPRPGAFKDGLLRVAPDILPPGRIRIGSVTADGEPYSDFDADGLTVRLPDTRTTLKFRVRLEPVDR
ncbi:AGE family epimerase/isomerase [Archangium violaceum]|uniref:AGE family epimerase/isomerase n=1 Tax=Archangium violaceum TaxID=83451 RepID=UPI001950135D|nr:AGE family epimerase/isomerase [Archangium violaceum]QRN95358.1 AGE family epimerase/isomerase [Archangium violaceum]